MQDVVIRTGCTERQPKRYAGSGLGKVHKEGRIAFGFASRRNLSKILFKIIQNTFGLLFNSLALSLFSSSSVSFAQHECLRVRHSCGSQYFKIKHYPRTCLCSFVPLRLEHYPLHRQSLMSSSSIFGNHEGAEVHEAVQDVVIRTGSTERQPKRYAGSGLGKVHRVPFNGFLFSLRKQVISLRHRHSS